MKILLGIIAFIEDQGQLRALRRVTKGVAEKIMKVRDHHRKLLGIMAVAVVDFLIQGPLAVGMAKQGRAHLAQIRATLFVFAAFRDIASPMKRSNKGIKVGAVIAHRIQTHGFTCHDIRDNVFPDGARCRRVETVHMVPEALRGQNGLGGVWKMPPQGGCGSPVEEGTFAQRLDGAVEGRQGDRGAHAQTLLALWTVGIDFVDDLGQATFFGQGFAQSEVKDLGVFRRWPSALNGVEDIVEFAEVLLPQASTSSSDPPPFGVVVIGISVDAFFFQALHVTSRHHE